MAMVECQEQYTPTLSYVCFAGKTTSDIVWHAFVMKTSNSDTIEVQASPQQIDVYVNGFKQMLRKINEFRGYLRGYSYLNDFRWKQLLII